MYFHVVCVDSICTFCVQLPLREVTEAALPAALLRLRANGYALVGLEQTADSVPLPHYRSAAAAC